MLVWVLAPVPHPRPGRLGPDDRTRGPEGIASSCHSGCRARPYWRPTKQDMDASAGKGAQRWPCLKPPSPSMRRVSTAIASGVRCDCRAADPLLAGNWHAWQAAERIGLCSRWRAARRHRNQSMKGRPNVTCRCGHALPALGNAAIPAACGSKATNSSHALVVLHARSARGRRLQRMRSSLSAPQTALLVGQIVVRP